MYLRFPFLPRWEYWVRTLHLFILPWPSLSFWRGFLPSPPTLLHSLVLPESLRCHWNATSQTMDPACWVVPDWWNHQSILGVRSSNLPTEWTLSDGEKEMGGNVSGVSSPSPVLSSVDTLEIRFFLMASSVALAPELPWILQPSLRRASTESPPNFRRASTEPLCSSRWSSGSRWITVLQCGSTFFAPFSFSSLSLLGLAGLQHEALQRKCGLKYSTLEVVPDNSSQIYASSQIQSALSEGDKVSDITRADVSRVIAKYPTSERQRLMVSSVCSTNTCENQPRACRQTDYIRSPLPWRENGFSLKLYWRSHLFQGYTPTEHTALSLYGKHKWKILTREGVENINSLIYVD